MFVDYDSLRTALAQHGENILSVVSTMLADRPHPVARDGVVVNSSWQSAGTHAGTVEVVFGDSATIFGDDPYEYSAHEKHVPVGGDIGRQSAPVGGERVVLIPAQTGWVALHRHGEDDSPGALAGEHWIIHRDQTGPAGEPYLGAINAHLKLTNDGAQANDAKGGLAMLAGSLLSILTGAGIIVKADDHAKLLTLQTSDGSKVLIDGSTSQVTVTTAGGNRLVLTDSNGSVTVSNSAGAKLDLLADGSIDVAATSTTYVGSGVVLANRINAGGASPVVRVVELQTAIDNLTTTINAAFARCQGGGGVTGIVGPVATGSPNVRSG